MRFLEDRALSGAILLYVLFFASASVAQVAPSDDNVNRLFVDAVMRYRAAEVQPPAEAAETRLEVRRLFDVITGGFPGSRPAEAIRAGGSPGGVDLARLPDDPMWYQTIVPGGRMANGYSHGQYPSEGDVTHPGWDIGGGCGLPIYAPMGGTVVRAISSETTGAELAAHGISWADHERDLKRNTGNALILQHKSANDGPPIFSLYLHMETTPGDEDGIRWRHGDAVPIGARLGFTGETGFANGCHTHFEVRTFEGIRKIYHPEVGKIYLPGDARDSQIFNSDWIDPAAWLRTAFLHRYLENSGSAPTPEYTDSGNETSSPTSPDLVASPDSAGWLKTMDADIALRPGESSSDFRIEGDGRTFYGGVPIFPPAADPDAVEIRLYPSPDGKSALVMQWDLDWGGQRVALLDLAAGLAVRSDIIPETAFRTKAAGDDVRIAMLPITWSPDSEFVAFPYSAVEWQADLAVIEAATGRARILQPNGILDKHWAFPNMGSLTSTGTFGLLASFDHLTCSNRECEAPTSVGDLIAHFSLEHEFPRTGDSSIPSTEGVESLADPGAQGVSRFGAAWGPGIVAMPRREIGYGECGVPRLRDCLDALGVTDEAIRFAEAVTDEKQIGVTLATEFHELGMLDLVKVNHASYESEGFFLVNGSTPIQPVGDALENLQESFFDAASQRILAAYPEATDWITAVSSHRRLAAGGQQFAMKHYISESCRACPIVGIGITYLYFDLDGKLLLERNVGVMDWRGRDYRFEVQAGDLQRDARLLQYRLNLLGYHAGSMDGVPGPQTAAALRAFQFEHCIAPTGHLDTATATALTAPDVFTATCENHAIPKYGEVSLLGRYETVPPSETSCDYAPLTISNTEIYFYESICQLPEPIVAEAQGFTDELDCTGEGSTWREPTSLSLTASGDLIRLARGNSFIYRRCEGAAGSELVAGHPTAAAGPVPSKSPTSDSTLADCAVIDDEVARLECYDGSGIDAQPSPKLSSQDAAQLSSALTFGTQSAVIDSARCELSLYTRVPVMKKVLSAGGWSDWMGSTTQGEAKVGETTTAVFVPFQDIAEAEPGGPATPLILRARQGQQFTVETTTRRNDDPGLNTSNRSAASVAMLAVPSLQYEAVNQSVRRFMDHCGVGATAATGIPTSSLDTEVIGKLNAHPHVQERTRRIFFVEGAFEAAIAEGLLARMTQHAQAGIVNHGNSWQAAVTPRGRERGIESATPLFFTAAQPQMIDIAVTEKTDISQNQDAMTVEFLWSYEEPPLLVQRLGERGGTGNAQLRLWDDGWRVETVRITGNGLGFPTTDEVRAAADLDVVMTRNEGGPWIFAEREQIFIPIESGPLLTSDERNARVDSIAVNKRDSVIDLLTNNKVTLGTQLRYKYALEGQWFEMMQGTSRVALMIEDLDLNSGRLRAIINPLLTQPTFLGSMRFLTRDLGFLEGSIDMDSFVIVVDYYKATGQIGNFGPDGPAIVKGIKLFPRFDGTGHIQGWLSGGDDFGGLLGEFRITNNKITE